MTGITENVNALYAVGRFIALGWKDYQAYAMVGNDYRESLMIPSIEGDKNLKHDANGIAQWRAARFDALVAYATTHGGKDWTDLDAQIGFQDYELRTTEQAAGKRLAASTTLEEAVKAAIGYHRPRGYTLAHPEKGEAYAKRLAAAQELAAALAPKLAATTAPATAGVIPVIAGRLQDALKGVPQGQLQQGDSGPVVALAQRKLAAFGYLLKGTGFYGGATEVAVKDYQTKRGKTAVGGADGVIGPMTARDIDAMEGKPLLYVVQDSVPAAASAPVDYPLWLKFALAQVNVVEKAGSGNNPTIMAWAKAEGGSVAKNYTADSIPWCALFENMIFTKCNIKGTETLWALDWNDWGIKLAGPAVGAVAPMKREGGGHVFTVVGRDKAGNVIGVGGNQSDAVNIRGVPKERPLSYRWPVGVSLPKLVGYGYLPIVDANGKILTKAA